MSPRFKYFLGHLIIDMREHRSKDDSNRFSRRLFLGAGTATLATGLAGCLGGGSGSGDSGDGGGGSNTGTTVGSASEDEYADTLRILMWPYYDLDTINDPFTDEYGISIETAYFDGNSEAYNQLRSGGAEEFDIVMADSFWPQQYYSDGLIQEVDPSRLPHLDNVFDTFHPDNQDLHIADDGAYLGPPNAWGGYGMTYNPDEVPESDVESFMTSLYNEEYSGHISTSARQTMNIANAGMALGYNDPQGSIWGMCDDGQLEEISNLLIGQKDWVITRYNDTRNLDRLYKQGDLWLFPEFSDAYRRLAVNGENVRHKLLTEEGGLGWLENWMMTSGVESEAKENAVYAFMDWRLQKQWMKVIAEEVGGAPSADIRDEFSDRENQIYFQDRVDVFNDLTQFDIPQCPETWQEYWSQVQSA